MYAWVKRWSREGSEYHSRFYISTGQINVNTVELEPEPAARVPGSIEVNPKTNWAGLVNSLGERGMTSVQSLINWATQCEITFIHPVEINEFNDQFSPTERANHTGSCIHNTNDPIPFWSPTQKREKNNNKEMPPDSRLPIPNPNFNPHILIWFTKT